MVSDQVLLMSVSTTTWPLILEFLTVTLAALITKSQLNVLLSMIVLAVVIVQLAVLVVSAVPAGMPVLLGPGQQVPVPSAPPGTWLAEPLHEPPDGGGGGGEAGGALNAMALPPEAELSLTTLALPDTVPLSGSTEVKNPEAPLDIQIYPAATMTTATAAARKIFVLEAFSENRLSLWRMLLK